MKNLNELADKVVITNATGNEALFLKAVQDLVAGVRELAKAEPCAEVTVLNGQTFTKHLKKLPDGMHLLYAYPPIGQAHPVPDGWKLVPIEPTAEMIAAAMGRYHHTSESAAQKFKRYHAECFKHDYCAMIAAAQDVK